MTNLYIGTYTRRASKGIYLLNMDPATGKLGEPVLAAETANPSFLAVDSSRRFLYAVGELAEFAGKKSGAIRAFAIEPGSGLLTLLNEQPAGGPGTCHLTVDRAGRHVLAANYAGGSVCVIPIERDGRLAAPSEFIQHVDADSPAGCGDAQSLSVGIEGPDRPRPSHAHSINLDAAERFAFVADLGLDKVFVYRFDSAGGKLTPNDPPAATLAPGAGPRHFAFHPTGRFAYVINELASTVTAFAYDSARGALSELGSVSTLPRPADRETDSTAEVAVHPSGRFLYGSNRGHDSIAIFAIDDETGWLTAVGHQSTEGKTPRHFAIDPSGTFLLAANQDSDSLVVFRIDPAGGKLTPTGSAARVPSPVCVRFVPGAS